MGLDVHRIALVFADAVAGVGGQHALGNGQVLVGAQHGHVKAAALHLHQLVDQHVAGGADLALEAQAAAQQEGLAEGAAIGEFREIQVDAVHAFERQLLRIGIVGQFEQCFGL